MRVAQVAIFLKRPTDMNRLRKRIHDFLASEEGPTAVEYAVMLALIVIVCVTAIGQVGHEANHQFEDVGDALSP